MYQRILLGVASLRINKVDHGKARVIVCHFGPYGEYRVNEAASNKILWYAIYFHPIEWAQQVSASAVKTELRSPLSRDTYKYKNIHPLKCVSLSPSRIRVRVFSFGCNLHRDDENAPFCHFLSDFSQIFGQLDDCHEELYLPVKLS